jgi:hypothetical protein
MKPILIGSLIIVSTLAFSADQKETRAYLKACNEQWNFEQNGRHRHIGRAVCDCLADAVIQYKAKHSVDYQNSEDYQLFYKKASQVCTTGGVLANSVDRAVFFSIYDEPTIENICKSSWVGLIGSFHPQDKSFNSAKICHCASPKLVEMVNSFDTMSPKDLRFQSLELVKKCDPAAKLSLSEFSPPSKNTSVEEAPSDKGKFILEIKDNKNPKLKNIEKYLKQDGRLNDIVNAMNQTLRIPYDIKIIVTDTAKGPRYSYKEKTIYLDYNMMALQLKLYDKYHPNESAESRRHYFNNVNRFFLYHELGHALIDAYHLPVLGQEEDGADALGAVISLKYLPKGYQVLVDSADFFNLYDRVQGTDESSYWDEHDLNRQRYYRLLCYAYGKSPVLVEKKIQHFYNKGLNEFMKDRADYCHYGYNEAYFSWMVLLQPYLKANVSEASPKS